MAIDPRSGTAPPLTEAEDRAETGRVAESTTGREASSEPRSDATITAPVVAPPTDDHPRQPLPSPPGPPVRAVSGDARSGRATAPSGVKGRYEARQVTRVLTRVDPWSVLKVSLLFALSMWLILVTAGVVLWRVAISTGTIGKFENFMAEILAEPDWVVDGMQIFRASLVGALVLVALGTVFAVVFSVLFNLISGLTGGLRMNVIELETARPAGERPVRS